MENIARVSTRACEYDLVTVVQQDTSGLRLGCESEDTSGNNSPKQVSILLRNMANPNLRLVPQGRY